MSGRRSDAGHSMDTGGPRGSHRRHANSCGRGRTRSGTAAPAGLSRAGSGMRAGHGRSQARGWPPWSAVPWPACPPWCPPQPATVSSCGQPDGCGGVRCPGCGQRCGHAALGCPPPHAAAAGEVSAATGSGRPGGVRWSGAATAARPAGAAGQAARGAARAHRSWPAAPVPGPPRRSARRAGGP
jgi:hypothetical protein